MFFMMGITEGRKEFEQNQVIICDRCGAYGRYVVFMTYTVLSLFFIPCFKWNRQYFVRTTCCGRVYHLDAEIGRRIERGEDVEIRAEHLRAEGRQAGADWHGKAGQETGAGQWSKSGYRRCGNCGFSTQEDFEYCPKCGRRF